LHQDFKNIIMNYETIKIERRKYDYSYIAEVIQRGRIKPAKFRHSFVMPLKDWERMRDAGKIDIEIYFIDESAFFEFQEKSVTISFINLSACNDFSLRVYSYKLFTLLGRDPYRRFAQSKMNFDNSPEIEEIDD
jgi:hypothetical protein